MNETVASEGERAPRTDETVHILRDIPDREIGQLEAIFGKVGELHELLAKSHAEGALTVELVIAKGKCKEVALFAARHFAR